MTLLTTGNLSEDNNSQKQPHDLDSLTTPDPAVADIAKKVQWEVVHVAQLEDTFKRVVEKGDVGVLKRRALIAVDDVEFFLKALPGHYRDFSFDQDTSIQVALLEENLGEMKNMLESDDYSGQDFAHTTLQLIRSFEAVKQDIPPKVWGSSVANRAVSYTLPGSPEAEAVKKLKLEKAIGVGAEALKAELRNPSGNNVSKLVKNLKSLMAMVESELSSNQDTIEASTFGTEFDEESFGDLSEPEQEAVLGEQSLAEDSLFEEEGDVLEYEEAAGEFTDETDAAFEYAEDSLTPEQVEALQNQMQKLLDAVAFGKEGALIDEAKNISGDFEEEDLHLQSELMSILEEIETNLSDIQAIQGKEAFDQMDELEFEIARDNVLHGCARLKSLLKGLAAKIKKAKDLAEKLEDLLDEFEWDEEGDEDLDDLLAEAEAEAAEYTEEDDDFDAALEAEIAAAEKKAEEAELEAEIAAAEKEAEEAELEAEIAAAEKEAEEAERMFALDEGDDGEFLDDDFDWEDDEEDVLSEDPY